MFTRLKAQGRATPLDAEVQITDISIWYIKAYQLLARDKQIGMAQGPIPMTSMFRYIDRYTLIGSDEEFISVITEMDNIAMKHASDEKAKENRKMSQKQR